MKELLKNLGLILVLPASVILLVCQFTGNVNNNVILGSCGALLVIGLVTYIVLNKQFAG